MTAIDFTTNTVRYRQLWGNENTELSRIDTRGIDILEFRESYIQLPGLSAFRDGVIDLSVGVDAAYEKFDKGFKYEVRRAEKDGFTGKEVELSEVIVEAYYSFSDRKKIVSINKASLDLYRKNKLLFVSAAFLNEIPLQYHLYFAMEKEIILLASFPAAEDPGVKKTAVGFANRYLHWFDIRHAANIGKGFYNLGGMGNDADNRDTAGIAKFKREMAPAEINYYQGIIPVSLKGKLYIGLKKILNKNA